MTVRSKLTLEPGATATAGIGRRDLEAVIGRDGRRGEQAQHDGRGDQGGRGSGAPHDTRGQGNDPPGLPGPAARGLRGRGAHARPAQSLYQTAGICRIGSQTATQGRSRFDSGSFTERVAGHVGGERRPAEGLRRTDGDGARTGVRLGGHAVLRVLGLGHRGQPLGHRAGTPCSRTSASPSRIDDVRAAIEMHADPRVVGDVAHPARRRAAPDVQDAVQPQAVEGTDARDTARARRSPASTRSPRTAGGRGAPRAAARRSSSGCRTRGGSPGDRRSGWSWAHLLASCVTRP